MSCTGHSWPPPAADRSTGPLPGPINGSHKQKVPSRDLREGTFLSSGGVQPRCTGCFSSLPLNVLRLMVIRSRAIGVVGMATTAAQRNTAE
jgi:hypothetical protein